MEQHFEDLQHEERLQALREGLQERAMPKSRPVLSVHLRS